MSEKDGTAGSSLRNTGSTRAWRRLRSLFAHHLATVGPLLCRRCGKPITADMAWDLGHGRDRAIGGDDRDVWPEHSGCNRSAGAIAGNARRRPEGERRDPPPSRVW